MFLSRRASSYSEWSMKYRNAFTFCFEHIVSLISSLFSPDASSDWPLKFLPFQATLIQLSTTDLLTHLLATLQVFTICCIDWIALRQDYVLIAGHTHCFSGSAKVVKFGISLRQLRQKRVAHVQVPNASTSHQTYYLWAKPRHRGSHIT